VVVICEDRVGEQCIIDNEADTISECRMNVSASQVVSM